MYQKQSPSDSFFGHSIDNLNNKNVNKDPTSFTMNDCNDQNDDGYETGVSDMMSMKYKHHPSFATLPPSSPFSSISSISSTTPTNFANSQQQQSPIYNLGNNASYHYHHQQYQQSQMLNLTENNSQSSYNHHHPNENMTIYGASSSAHNDPYNFASHEFQHQMNSSHFNDVNDGKMMMSLDHHSDNAMKDSMKFSQPPKYCNENGGTNGNPGDFFSTLLDDKNMSLTEKTNSSKLDATKKRGRKRKVKDEDNGDPTEKPKGRRKHDRFNGMSEEELSQRQLPDHLTYNLDIVIIGINPGLFAAYKGHHYSGPGNHFWKCMFLSGLTPVQMTAEEDFKLLELGIGFTNIVQRPTKGSADLTRKEIKDGCRILLEKLQKFRPKIAVFNGKLIYEVFSGKKDFYFGKQADIVEGTNTHIWVMPSSSARCAQLPRAADKVPFYAALKKFKDYQNGLVAEYIETDYVFTDPKYNQIASTPSNPDNMLSPDGMEPSDIHNNSNKKKRGRPKKKNEDSNESINCTQTKELDGELLDDKHNSKKKRGRPKKEKGEPSTKSSKKNKNSQIPKNFDNCLIDRSSISPAMESSSSFSNPHQTQQQPQQHLPVQVQPSTQNGKCNQSSRNQSPSLNMCHQTNLEMKPMIGDIHSPHQIQQQDSNITYQHQQRNSTQSPMVKEESLNLNDLSSSFNPPVIHHDHKPLPSLISNDMTSNLDMRHDFTKTNGVPDDNLKQFQQYHSNVTAGSNQINQSIQHPHAHAFHLHQQQQQQQQQQLQNQHHLFQNSTPHLISNITSETTTVYQNQQQRAAEQAQVEPPTSYPTTTAFVPPNEKQFASHFTEQNKDISLKSLSGLESLVDQIANNNPDQETTPTVSVQTPTTVTAAPTPSYAAPYGSQHYVYPSHPSAHGQHFSSPFPPIGSFASPSYPSFTNYHQNLINQSHVGMPVNPVYPNTGYPHHSSLLPYANYGSGAYTQGSNSYYNPMFDRINF